MAFHNVRLPDDVERGARGGPRFRTTVLTLSSGFERRNIEWARTRGEWDIGYGLQTKADINDVIAFFYARQGRAHGFRFKDWTDFQITTQSIGTTDGSNATFQIFKAYTDAAATFNRILTRIVDNSVTLTVNSVTIAEGAGASQYQLNDDTGIITLGSTLAAQSGTDVAITCEFDVPVRFDQDELDLVAERDDVLGIPQIPVVELREA